MKLLSRFLLVVLALAGFVSGAQATPSTNLVISQVYLGPGTTATKPRYQFVELFNRGTTAVDVSTWSVQYVVEGSSTWQAFTLTGTINPGQYYLVQLGITSGVVALPNPDLTISLTLPTDTARFAIANVSAAMDTGCPADGRIVDLIGYGSTGCKESQALSSQDPDVLASYVRKGGGCVDTDVNNLDFTNVTPVLRNSSSVRNPCYGSTGTKAFSLAAGGGSSFQTNGSATAPVVTGYARIQADSTSVAPAGVAIYGQRQSGTLITETGVTAAPLTSQGFMYVELNGLVTTGIAIANPNAADVKVTYSIYDSGDVTNIYSGSVTIAAGAQIAKYLNDWPFNSRAITGILRFNATAPVSVTALRGYSNERNEFLVSTLPVLDPDATRSTNPAFLPHFAIGGGWRTELILINPLDVPISGTVTFADSSGNPISLPVGTLPATNSLPYQVQQSRTVKFVFPNSGPLQTGVMTVTPTSGGIAPIVLGVFSLTPSGTRVAEASIIGVLGNQVRTYMETSNVGSVGSIQTGVAIANISGASTNVTLEAFNLNGTSTNLTKSITLPAGGKYADFMDNAFPTLSSFKGILKVTSSGQVDVLAVRGRINERKEFLVATLPVVPETSTGSSAEVEFPHIVDSAGYTTQFVLLEKVTGTASTGTIRFRTVGGQILDLPTQ